MIDPYGELLKALKVWLLWWTRGYTISYVDTYQTRPSISHRTVVEVD